jgi:tyrosine-protein kinase Etk/Wzc
MVDTPSPVAERSSETDLDLFDLLQVFVDNLRLLVFGPLFIGLIVLGVTFVVKPKFTGKTSFMPPLQQQSTTAMMLQSLGAVGGLASAATGIKNPNDQFVALVKSETIANRLIDRFQLQQRYEEEEYRSSAQKKLAARTTVTAGKDNLIVIEVLDEDPKVAAELANTYVTEFGELLKRLAITEAQQRRQFFEKQLLQTKDNLVKAESALRASGVNTTAIKSAPDLTVRTVAELQGRIAGQEIKLASMRGYLTDSSPDFRQALNELSALRAQLAKVEGNSLSSVNIAPAEANYVARVRDVKYHETLFEMLARQFELAKADEAREGVNVQVVDTALPPDRKSQPKRGIIAIVATLAAGVLLTLFVFVRHAWRQAASDARTSPKLARLGQSWRSSLQKGSRP